MWLRTIFRRRNSPAKSPSQTVLDEQFLRRLERLSLVTARSLPGGLSGEHSSRRRLPAPTFSDHRPYSTGDDLRYVDWNAYARLDHLHLKLGEAEQDIRVSLLLDCSASMEWGSGDQNKLHFARLLAAAIGYIALANGDHLQVVPFGAGNQPLWGPGSGRRRTTSLLQFLEGLRSGGERNITAALEEVARQPRGGLLVIASDLLHSETLQAALTSFHPPRWQVLVLHLLHPEELRPALQGDLELVDSETGARVASQIDRPALERYAAAVEQWRQQLARTFGRREIAYVGLTTDTPVERAAIPFLRARGALR